MPRFSSFIVAVAVLATAACARASQASPTVQTPPATQQPGQAPTLVVFLTVDQMRADYLDRFRAQLTGGLARLDRGGAVFTNAFQDHAITETAPGHSVTMSG